MFLSVLIVFGFHYERGQKWRIAKSRLYGAEPILHKNLELNMKNK